MGKLGPECSGVCVGPIPGGASGLHMENVMYPGPVCFGGQDLHTQIGRGKADLAPLPRSSEQGSYLEGRRRHITWCRAAAVHHEGAWQCMRS